MQNGFFYTFTFMKVIRKEELVQIGFISKPHGFKGELIFAIETGEPEDYENLKFFFIELDGKPVPFFVEEIKARATDIIVKLEDVNTEAEAKTLLGKSIFLDESEIDPVEDEIDWNSLIGYMVFDSNAGKLGVLESIEEYPQQLIGKCTINGKEVLFPINEDLIVSIDDEKQELHLDLPEGLLDVYLGDS